MGERWVGGKEIEKKREKTGKERNREGDKQTD